MDEEQEGKYFVCVGLSKKGLMLQRKYMLYTITHPTIRFTKSIQEYSTTTTTKNEIKTVYRCLPYCTNL